MKHTIGPMLCRLDAGEKAPSPTDAPARAAAAAPKRGKKKLIIGLIGVAVLAALAVCFFTVHFWTEATYDAPMTCRLCGKTQGEKRGWVGEIETTETTETVDLDGFQITGFMLDGGGQCFRRLTVRFWLFDQGGYPFGEQTIYVHDEIADEWDYADTVYLIESEQGDVISVELDYPEGKWIDGVAVAPFQPDVETAEVFHCVWVVDAQVM